MDRKRFNGLGYLMLTAAFLTFATLGGGGCGGSGGGSGATRNLSGSGIGAYLTGDVYEALVEEYVKEANATAAMRAAIEKVEFLREAYEGESETVPDEKLVEDLENGKVLALVYPDTALINDFLNDLGVEENYARPSEDSTDYLELFAVAQRTVNGSPQIFTYSIADLDNFVVVSDTLTSANFPPEGYVANQYAGDFDGAEPDIIVAPGTEASFQGSRVKEFLAWVAGLDKAAEDWGTDDAADAASLRVAAGDTQLASLASANSTPKFQFTYSQEDVRRLGTDWKTNRENNLNYRIWSLHSFENRNDYFVIELDADTDPSKQFSSWLYAKDYEPGDFVKVVRRAMGLYTLRLTFDHELVGGGSDVAVEKYAPANLNKSRTKTEGIMEQFGTKLGISKAPGVDFSYNVTYNSSETYTYSDYEIKAEDVSKNRAKWVWDFERPKDGKKVETPYRDNEPEVTTYYELIASDSITKPHRSKMRWIWSVAPGYWTRNKAAKVNVTYTWAEGASYGIMHRSIISDVPREDYTPMTIKKQDTLELPRPPHLAARPVSFAPTAGNKGFDKTAGNATLYVLSESEWTIKADASWISGFTPEKGAATGKTEVAVTFSYGANDTGKPRTANVTLTNTEGDKITIQVNQGGN